MFQTAQAAWDLKVIAGFTLISPVRKAVQVYFGARGTFFRTARAASHSIRTWENVPRPQARIQLAR